MHAFVNTVIQENESIDCGVIVGEPTSKVKRYGCNHCIALQIISIDK